MTFEDHGYENVNNPSAIKKQLKEIHVKKHRQTNRLTDRRTDGSADRRRDGRTDRQTVMHTDIQTN